MLLYMGLFCIMLTVVYLMYKKDWESAHFLLLVLWIVKVFFLFVLSKKLSGNYEYYDVILMLVLLFLPHKHFFLRLSFVWLYFLASTIKIHEGWILGTYFTSLQTGLPLFGDAVAPVVTGIVIAMQIIGSWFLLTNSPILQRTALVYFILFHVYSGILVGYRYPSVALVMLIILFAIPSLHYVRKVPLDRRALPGFVLLALMMAGQFVSIIIPGDEKMTLEGNNYGLYMFEANHQCISRETVHMTNGESRSAVRSSYASSNRCDPYDYWFALRNACRRGHHIERISWTFDHSINGGPFYRIVSEDDACQLSYKPFAHNNWIRLVEDGATVVGHPRKNFYYNLLVSSRSPTHDVDEDGLLTIPALEGNDPARKTVLQERMSPFVDELIAFWWIAWFGTLAYVMARFVVIPIFRSRND